MELEETLPSLGLASLLVAILTFSSANNVAIYNSHFLGNTGTNPALHLAPQTDFQVQIQPSQFLVKNGTIAYSSVFVTPINGFVGNVTLSYSISPSQNFAPTVSFSPPILDLEPFPYGETTSIMIVNATADTEIGLYYVNVTGSSNNLSHWATATVGVTSMLVPAGGVDLVYKAQFTSTAYAGGSTDLNSTFEDLGSAGLGITKLSVSSDFGTFDRGELSCNSTEVGCRCLASNLTQCAVPIILYVNPYQALSFAMTLQIPNGTSPGNHLVTITVSWDVNPGSIPDNSAPDLVTHGYLVVYAPPSPQHTSSPKSLFRTLIQLAEIALPIMGIATIITIVTTVLVIRTRQKDEVKDQSMLEYLVSAKEALFKPTCASCGSLIVFGSKFCEKCGHPVS